MKPAQTQLYWRTWQGAARAHGWTSKPGVTAALEAHRAGRTWVSPELDRIVAQLYRIAEALAQAESRSVGADDLRRACSIAAVGRQVSSKAFTNADFDKVLVLLRLLANPEDLNNLAAFQDTEAGERRRHIHTITRADASYWQAIARDKFGHADLERLTLVQLQQLSLTIRSRLQRTAVKTDTP